MRIGIAGSMSFSQQMLDVAKKLRRAGHDVFISRYAKSYARLSSKELEATKLHDKYRNNAIFEFTEQMKEADALLVLNFDKNGIKNYIGGNAFLEMGYAYILGQKIFLWNKIPDMPYYGTEIIALKPIVINGDLKLIQ